MDRVEETLQSMYSVDVIFLGLDMPSSNGYDVLKKLKDSGIDAPIIAHTVHVDDLLRIREAGLQGLLAKPLDIECFPDILQEIVAGKQS
ncbi:MAG: response regulator [Anaerolineae bacterium]|nr:response regulator [Anaerolineae bacterium]